MMHVQPPKGVPVIAAQFLNPARERIEVTLGEGMTLAEIVAATLPGLPADMHNRCRVALTTPVGSMLVPADKWHAVKPKAGVVVTIRVIPAKGAIQSILQIAVSIAAIALGQFWLGPLISGGLGFAAGSSAALFVNSAATAVLGLAGSFLIQAIFRPRDQDKEKPTYVISGWRNEFKPDAPVPNILGKLRVAPPIIMQYTEIVGDDIYYVTLFNGGYGPVAFSDPKIGDTPLSKFEGVTSEFREGWDYDDPISICPISVFEDRFGGGVELTRNFDRDPDGEIKKPKNAPEKEEIRQSGTDAGKLKVIIAFPAGLRKFNDEGDERNAVVNVRIRARLSGTDEMVNVTTLNIKAKKGEPIYREHEWEPPVRGLYDVGVTRMTEESTSTKVTDRCVWYALQTIRPEYPVNFPHPLALIAIRAKGSYQLQGGIDRFNLVMSRIAQDWDSQSQTWIMRETQWPPSLMRLQLQGPSYLFPYPDSGISLPQLEDWHEFCVAKGLRYNRMHDFEADILENLFSICAAGRAGPRHDGVKWGVVIDRPQEKTVDHITPKNSWNFEISGNKFTPPDAFLTKFLDETRSYEPSQRYILWPADIRHATLAQLLLDTDHDDNTTAEVWNDPLAQNNGTWIIKAGIWEKKPIRVIETLDQPGVTHPLQVWVGGRRRAHELLLRPDTISLTQDGAVRVATRGDQVMGAWNILNDGTQDGFTVKAIKNRLVSLDRPVTMEEGKTYGCRWQHFTAEDTVGDTVYRNVQTVPGSSQAILLIGMPDTLPRVDGQLIFGEAGVESEALIVRATEPGEMMSTVFQLVAAAPEIDERTDADALAVPAFDGRVGNIASIVDLNDRLVDDDDNPLIDDDDVRVVDDGSAGAPLAPVITLIETEGSPPVVSVSVRPALLSGPVASYLAQHRLVGGLVWSNATGMAAESSVDLPGYASGDDIEIQVQAIDAAGRGGAFGPIVPFKVGRDMRFMPEIDTFAATRLASGLWRYEWTQTELENWQIPMELLGAQLRYRAGAWGAWEDLEPVLTGYASTSPWDTSTPIEDGVYTFGIKLVSVGGQESEPRLIYAVAPAGSLTLLNDDDAFALADDDNNLTNEDA